MSQYNPSEVYNPLSEVNMLTSFSSTVGLVLLGFAMYSIAKQHKNPGRDSTPSSRYTLNTVWSSAFSGVFIILFAFALAYAYD